MRLSTMARYGARAMVDLAANHESAPVTLSQIAGRQEISRGYLAQIMIPLRSRGIVRSVRGAGGGFALARPAAEITLAEVIEALEGRISVVKCTEDPSVCDQCRHCAILDVWAGLASVIHDSLSEVTLADLAARQATKFETMAATYSI